MRVRWLSVSERDLVRLYDFLKEVNPQAAARQIRAVIAATEHLPDFPQIGPRIEAYKPRDVRTLHVGDYELHYEVLADAVVILRVWHAREDR